MLNSVIHSVPAPSVETSQPFHAICRYMETHTDEPLSLITLATMAGLSSGHFQRQFKAAIGITPKQYATACRLGRLKEALQQTNSVTEAIYGAGFNASSRVYENLDNQLGMTPRQYQRGGQGLTIAYAYTETVLGLLMMAATDRGICFIQFAQPEAQLLTNLQTEFPHATLTPMPANATPQFEAWMTALHAHLAGHHQHLDLPLDIQGTVFQHKVWRYLQSIPYGETRSYREVAQGIGHPKAIRAAASACGANNVAIVIPCHRVLRGTGALGGYRWGIGAKQTLLDIEQRTTTP